METYNVAKDISKYEGKYSLIGVENKVFPTTFLLLKLVGLWMPTTLKFPFLYTAYQFYSVFCFANVLMLIISVLLVKIVPGEESVLSLTEYLYMLIIWSNGLLKILNLIIKRKKVIYILGKNVLKNRWSIPRDEEEIMILKKTRKEEKEVTQLWFGLLVFNYLFATLYPILRDNPNNTLMFESYTPCDRSVATCYWVCYAYQCIGYATVSIVHAGYDCIIFNFMQRTSAHMKIFQHRLVKLPSIIKEQLDNNVYSSRLIEEVNDAFYELVCIQFISSILVMCTNIFFLSKQALFSIDFLTVFAFFCCVLAQNFFYCWYGHKLPKTMINVNSIFWYNYRKS